MEKTTLRVEGMSCGHCEAAVQDAVLRLPGIRKVKADSRKKEVALKYDPSQVSLDQISEAIGEAGYEVVI